MFLPAIFRNGTESFLPDDFFAPFMGAAGKESMKTDVKDMGDHYGISLEIPGVRKEDIHASVKDGALTISAEKKSESEEKDEKYIRRERFYGKYERSFYVGENVKEDDIKASYENGVLRIDVPKTEEKKEEPKGIKIE